MIAARIIVAAGALGLSAIAMPAARRPETIFIAPLLVEHDSLRPGPDSALVTRVLDALGKTEPLVCEMIADQVGNFWTNEGHTGGGIGRFADASRTIFGAKDSLSGHSSDAAAIRVMQSQLAAPNACVRRVAAKLLGRSRVPTERIAALMQDRSPLVREAAAYAAGGGSGDRKGARGALVRLVESGSVAEAAMATWALGELEDSASIPVLTRAARSSEVRVRLAAVWALGSIGNARSVTTFAVALDDASMDVRVAAARALSDVHDLEHAPEALVRAARSTDPRLRAAAAHALAEIHDPATVDVLISLLSSEDRDVRLDVVHALGEIKSTKAQPGLVRALKDPDPEVRKAAAEALGEIREG